MSEVYAIILHIECATVQLKFSSVLWHETSVSISCEGMHIPNQMSPIFIYTLTTS